jgi:hypothetical protein
MKNSIRIKEYYVQKGFNVVQTALENVAEKYDIKIKNDTTKNDFIIQSNLTADLMNEITRLGYRLVKKS